MDRPGHLAQIGEVGGHYNRDGAEMFHLFRGVGQLVLRTRHESHGHPRRGQLNHDRLTDAPSGSRHHGSLALKRNDQHH